MRWEGAPETDCFRQATEGYLNEQSARAVNRAGVPDDHRSRPVHCFLCGQPTE